MQRKIFRTLPDPFSTGGLSSFALGLSGRSIGRLVLSPIRAIRRRCQAWTGQAWPEAEVAQFSRSPKGTRVVGSGGLSKHFCDTWAGSLCDAFLLYHRSGFHFPQPCLAPKRPTSKPLSLETARRSPSLVLPFGSLARCHILQLDKLGKSNRGLIGLAIFGGPMIKVALVILISDL